jgi:tetrahydromethanopterin S-methyltransferase subunit B
MVKSADEKVDELKGVVSELANQVTKVVTVVEFEVERGKEDRIANQSVLTELKSINEKISSMHGVNEKLSELNTEVGKLRHDFRNVENTLNSLPLMQEKHNALALQVARVETKQTEMERIQIALTLQDAKQDGVLEGVVGVIKTISEWMWRLTPVAVAAYGAYYGLTHGGVVDN